jgi:GNAT superfamily N-acetyltransferase
MDEYTQRRYISANSEGFYTFGGAIISGVCIRDKFRAPEDVEKRRKTWLHERPKRIDRYEVSLVDKEHTFKEWRQWYEKVRKDYEEGHLQAKNMHEKYPFADLTLENWGEYKSALEAAKNPKVEGNRCFLVTVRDKATGQIVGFGWHAPHRDYTASQDLAFVHPQARGQDLLRKIMTNVLENAKKFNYPFFETKAENPYAATVLRKMGFETSPEGGYRLRKDLPIALRRKAFSNLEYDVGKAVDEGRSLKEFLGKKETEWMAQELGGASREKLAAEATKEFGIKLEQKRKAAEILERVRKSDVPEEYVNRCYELFDWRYSDSLSRLEHIPDLYERGVPLERLVRPTIRVSVGDFDPVRFVSALKKAKLKYQEYVKIERLTDLEGRWYEENKGDSQIEQTLAADPAKFAELGKRIVKMKDRKKAGILLQQAKWDAVIEKRPMRTIEEYLAEMKKRGV